MRYRSNDNEEFGTSIFSSIFSKPIKKDKISMPVHSRRKLKFIKVRSPGLSLTSPVMVQKLSESVTSVQVIQLVMNTKPDQFIIHTST